VYQNPIDHHTGLGAVVSFVETHRRRILLTVPAAVVQFIDSGHHTLSMKRHKKTTAKTAAVE
jgi:hypothetical protein